jgi:hypothetical protein
MWSVNNVVVWQCGGITKWSCCSGADWQSGRVIWSVNSVVDWELSRVAVHTTAELLLFSLTMWQSGSVAVCWRNRAVVFQNMNVEGCCLAV